MKLHSISSEQNTKLYSFQLEDTPEMQAYLFCLGKDKNVYRSSEGFEPDRFLVALRESVNTICNEEFIRNCGEKYKAVLPEELMFFNIVKCVVDNRRENCHKVA